MSDAGRSREAVRADFAEALHEYGYVRCGPCEDAGNPDLAHVDLSYAENVDEAIERWNDHVREVHQEGSA